MGPIFFVYYSNCIEGRTCSGYMRDTALFCYFSAKRASGLNEARRKKYEMTKRVLGE